MQTVSGVRIAGTGHYLPGSPITQDELRTRFRAWPDCLPERVRDALLAESGIQTRYFGVALDGSGTRESNASMAARAGRRALEAAGWTPRDVDLLIVTTVIPDQLIPPTSTLVQQALGIPVCMELEISANCTAPYKALQVAANQLRLGEHRRALVCSVQFVSFLGMPPWASPERMTPSQAQLRWILSDGAGAIALERGDPDIELRTWIESRATNRRPGMELQLGAGYADLAGTIARGGHHVSQRARRLRTDALREGITAFGQMLAHLAIPASSIDHAIPELPGVQYGNIVREHAAVRFALPPSAWRFDVAEIGNVGGATLPIVLDRLVRAQRVRRGELVVSFAEESSNWMFAGVAFRWNP